MFKRLVPLVLGVAVATAAFAQPSGPKGGPKGGPGGARPPAAPHAASLHDLLPIVGVVKAIDTQTQRITIAYEPVESLGWPAGSQPFPVSKSAMLTVVTVGEKIRFAVQGGEIAALAKFGEDVEGFRP
jgi:Cu/Ag efflux protein CusF